MLADFTAAVSQLLLLPLVLPRLVFFPAIEGGFFSRVISSGLAVRRGQTQSVNSFRRTAKPHEMYEPAKLYVAGAAAASGGRASGIDLLN